MLSLRSDVHMMEVWASNLYLKYTPVLLQLHQLSFFLANDSFIESNKMNNLFRVNLLDAFNSNQSNWVVYNVTKTRNNREHFVVNEPWCLCLDVWMLLYLYARSCTCNVIIYGIYFYGCSPHNITSRWMLLEIIYLLTVTGTV